MTTTLGHHWFTVTALHALLMPLDLSSSAIPALSSLTLCARSMHKARITACKQTQEGEEAAGNQVKSSHIIPRDTNSPVNTVSVGVKEVTAH